MSMYGDQASFSDFAFSLDDLLVAKLIDAKVFRTLSGEEYAVIRATVRSELLYSDEVGAIVKPSIGKFLERAQEIEKALHSKVPEGLKGHGTANNTSKHVSTPRGREQASGWLPDGRSGQREPSIYGSTFLDFDDILVERWLPPQQAASLSSGELKAFGSLVKAELVFSEKVQGHLKKRIKETLQEVPKHQVRRVRQS
jgi:hypothetical protein